jgi:cytosine/adenosine deaminase-related metal-dependent hydrolase
MSLPPRQSILITGAHVLALDDAHTTGRLDIYCEDGEIREVAPRIHGRTAERHIDASGSIAMPGLVQAHVHLCQTLFRGQAEEMELLDWLQERIWPLEGALDAPAMRASARLGIAELLLGGTTSILDMGSVHHTDELFRAAEDLGLRYTGGKTLMDEGEGHPPSLQESTEDAVAESVRLCERWHGQAEGRLRYAFSPRFVLTASEEAVRGCVEEARRRGALLHTHSSESRGEIDLVRSRTGLTNVALLHELGFTGDDVVLAHGVWLSPEEREILKRTRTAITHCPSANLKLASGIAPVEELLGEGIRVALGADGAACNNTLDGFLEMRLAALLQKVQRGPKALPAAAALRLATRNGARALGLPHVGSIAPGKKADIVLLDTHRPHLHPGHADLASRVVYSAKSSDVHTVIVEGRVLVEGARLQHADLGEILEDADRAATALDPDAPGATRQGG